MTETLLLAQGNEETALSQQLLQGWSLRLLHLQPGLPTLSVLPTTILWPGQHPSVTPGVQASWADTSVSQGETRKASSWQTKSFLPRSLQRTPMETITSESPGVWRRNVSSPLEQNHWRLAALRLTAAASLYPHHPSPCVTAQGPESASPSMISPTG